MSAPSLNSVALQDTYTEATTVVFTQPRDAFQVQVSNNGVMYQLGTPNPSGRDPQWEAGEHALQTPQFAVFDTDDAAALGSQRIAGIRLRNLNAGRIALVSVS